MGQALAKFRSDIQQCQAQGLLFCPRLGSFLNGVVAHVILVSSQVPIDFGVGTFGGLGL